MFNKIFRRSIQKKEEVIKHIKMIDNIFQDVKIENEEDLNISKLSESYSENIEFKNNEESNNVVNFTCCLI